MVEQVRIPPELEGATIPRHIAIIMDGNGRWARKQGLRRITGHKNGAESVREIVRTCARIGVGRLTLYAFSYENWSRPKLETMALMRLLKAYLVGERKEIMDNGIRFTAIGRLDDLPKDVRAELEKTKAMSAGNTGMVLCLALSYSGRLEIVDAARRLAEDVKAGRVDGDVDDKLFARYLYDPDAPDPDLLIRTAGEMRVSNFLLWEISYSEIWVTDVCWPEFRKPNLFEAIRDFSKRERKFGGVGS